MATKLIPKVKKTKSDQPRDDFFVQVGKFRTIKKYREKIEQMYQVQIRYEKAAEEGKWLVLEGEHVDRRNAKNYIAALCNPSEVKQVQFRRAAWSKVTDPNALEDIEKKTNAVIKPLTDVAKFEISGTELAVTLAMSLMEELIGSIEGGEDSNEEQQSADDNFIMISPANKQASTRLSDVLQRALSEHSDGTCSVQDYNHTSDSVKRVLVNCLQDEEDIDKIDEELFSDGNVKNSDVMLRSSDAEEDEKDESDGNITKNSPGIHNLAEQLSEAVSVKSNDSSSTMTKQMEYLKSFGLSVGYSERDVKKALDFVDEKTRPSDFLDFLNSIKDNQTCDTNVSSDQETQEAIIESGKKPVIMISDDDDDDDDNDVVILETETIEVDENGKESKSVIPGDSNDSINSNLPERYREMFMLEDYNCSVEELKRRNAERQKLLKQNFENFAQQFTGAAVSQTKQNSKQNKKKKPKKAQQQQKLYQDATHDKQLRLDPCENRSYSNDNEQTCVFKVWNGDNGSGNFFAADSGKTSTADSTTPKRKQTGKFQGVDQTFASENHWQQAGRSNQRFDGSPSGSPSRGQGWAQKPTHVVQPMNYPISQPQIVPPYTAGEELRYIVIDGSNVAMTHGNGKCFSCRGLRICVDYFKQRGHTKITVFVPQWRTYQPGQANAIADQNILHELKQEDVLVFTPSRRIGGKLVVAYDDRFVLELAEAEDGIIVSNDNYRDLMHEKANWRRLIEERLLMFSFAGDHFMPPADPLGRDGPTLDAFLRKIKPRFPMFNQRPQGWQANQGQGFQRMQGYNGNPGFSKQGQGQNFRGQQHSYQQGIPYENTNYGQNTGQQTGSYGFKRGQGNFPALGQGQTYNARTDEETEQLYKNLRQIFPDPDQEECVKKVLSNHVEEKDITKLTNYCMSVLF